MALQDLSVSEAFNLIIEAVRHYEWDQSLIARIIDILKAADIDILPQDRQPTMAASAGKRPMHFIEPPGVVKVQVPPRNQIPLAPPVEHLRSIVAYMITDEADHWEDSGRPYSHIYVDLLAVQEWLDRIS